MNYYDRPELSNSDLSLIKKGYEFYLNKQKDNSFNYGRMVHKWILEKDTFFNEYQVIPFKDFRTKKAQSWKLEIEAKGITPIKDKDIKDLKLISKNFTFEIYGETEKELYYEYQDVPMRSKIDLIQDGNLYDLKTIDSLEEINLRNQFYRKDYGRQLGLYVKACQLNDIEIENVFIIWVNEFGFHRLMKVNYSELQNGLDRAKNLIKDYKFYKQHGVIYPEIQIGEL